MKKVLFIAAGLGAAGAERQITTVARLIKDEGYDVTVYCWNNENFFDDILINHGINLKREVAGGLIRLKNVRRYVRNGHFDVVISFLPTPNFCNEVAAIGGKKWRVITGERSSIIRAPQNIRERIFAYTKKYSDIMVCNSHNAQKKWQEVLPWMASKIITIYNAVNINPVSTDYVPRQNGKINIVITAAVYKLKNPMGLLEAFKLMTDEERKGVVVDWYGNSYATIGDTSEYDRFVKEIDNYGFNDVIRLHPATKDVSNVINKADAVALFSQLEGLPNAICEGMMVGKPIIMTRMSDYSDLVDDSNGFLCDWNNPESIKVAILKMSHLTPSELKSMGDSSKQKAYALFSPNAITNQWVEIIEKE